MGCQAMANITYYTIEPPKKLHSEVPFFSGPSLV